MEIWQGKHFSITDPKGVNTVIYQICKTPKKLRNEYPKYTVERLDFTEELRGENKRKTFYVDFPTQEDELVILSFTEQKVIVNTAILSDDKISISKSPSALKFNSIFTEEDQEYRDFRYTPNLKRPICIIDPETTEEVRPSLYLDQKTNEVYGKCKLKANKSYFAFEIKDDKEN